MLNAQLPNNKMVECYIIKLLNNKRNINFEGNLKKLHQGSTGGGWREAELRRDVRPQL